MCYYIINDIFWEICKMKLLAVDSNSIINRAYYGVRPLTTKDGVHTNAVYGFINILLKIIEDVHPQAIAFCFDVKRETFRNEIYAEYKAGRKPTPPELLSQFPLIKEFITLLGYKVVEKEGWEADDLIGTLSKSASENDTVVIATGDRDSLQLVSDRVSVRLASTKMGHPETVIYNTSTVYEKYLTTPKGLIEIKALMGDSSDNIPGVAGIGEKGAIDLISKYETIENIYENIETLPLSEKLKEKLINGKESAFLSKKLGTICCESPIERDFSFYKKEETSPELSDFLSRLELFSVLKKLDLKPTEKKSDAKTEELRFCTDENETKETLSKIENLFFDIDTDEEKLYFSENNTVYCLENEKDIIDTLSEKELFAVNSKKVYRYLLSKGTTPRLCRFDLELAGYLLSANAQGYSAENLSMTYGTPYNVVPDMFGGKTASSAASLKPLFEILDPLLEETGNQKLFKETELPLSLVLADMEHVGVKVDKEGIENFGKMLEERIEKFVTEIYTLAGREFNINSPKQLGEVLFSELEIPGGKKTKTGYSTSADVLENLKFSHPIIPLILEYRKLSKLNSTYVQGLLKAISSDGRIHSTFNQTETRTGRISSLEPNLQNIPVRTELGREMRRFFVAGENKSLIDADYSQIELRVLAHIAEDKALTEAFKNGEDVHTRAAMSVFGLKEDEVDADHRRRAKAVNFGIVYGIGAFSLSQDIGTSVREASEYIKNYLSVYSGVADFMKTSVENGKKNGFVSTLFGRRRYIPELSATNKNISAFGERIAMNAPIQGTAADIIKMAMVRVYNRLKEEKLDARLILQIHDELIIECSSSEAEKASAVLKEEMENAASLSVPLITDLNVGFSWYETK
jgi:DNA polymerase-1